MEKKLQSLLDKLYEEGVEKGQEVAEAIINDAEQKAEKIVAEARTEAADIRKQAEDDAEELRRNVISELQLSSKQAISALRQKISHLITAEAIAEPVDQTFSDEGFLKEIIETLINHWRPSENGQAGVSITLPEEQGNKLYEYFAAKSKQMMNEGIQVNFDHKLEKGFRIGPDDGRYVVSFTDKDFEAFFMDYLRPRTKELLYGEE